MMRTFFSILLATLIISCSDKSVNMNSVEKNITDATINQVMDKLKAKNEPLNVVLAKKGVEHAASLWRSEDGSAEEFEAFCLENYVSTAEEKEQVFLKISQYLESLIGHFNKLNLDMQWNIHLDNGPLNKIDHFFAGYDAGTHWQNDFYKNKIAFIIALNFPYYSTEEKNELGKDWSRLEWAYARLGDVSQARVPSDLLQAFAKVSAETEIYTSEYNIYAGHLLNQEKEKLFPEDMVLLSHWNIRDEIKSNYANKENGLEKQQMLYKVMQRIIDQSIPKEVINKGDVDWCPETNEVFIKEEKTEANPEVNIRYQQIIKNFKALKAIDKYNPDLDTYIKRKFSGEMQIPQPEVEKLFDELLSSPQVIKVAELIKQRLGRDLKPYDIWYDGFKSRSTISEALLDKITQSKYKNAKAFEADMPNLLVKLGFDKNIAEGITTHIAVDPARGSGHAWGAGMKSEKTRLRTRIPESGMNYKGYNIAIHEFGHNVEQTISMQDVDYYMLNGVPNTAFTEALAFTFQSRDLQLLGIKSDDRNATNLETLDIFWSVYEIMGVSIVDMKVWKWLYENPDCDADMLKEAIINIAKEVWNKYYAPVLGIKDQPILAIYTHMISYPLYLSAYAFGDLIHFQLEEHFKTHNFAAEVQRIYALGLLTPDAWMKEAVGEPLSIQPILKSVDEAVKNLAVD